MTNNNNKRIQIPLVIVQGLLKLGAHLINSPNGAAKHANVILTFRHLRRNEIRQAKVARTVLLLLCLLPQTVQRLHVHLVLIKHQNVIGPIRVSPCQSKRCIRRQRLIGYERTNQFVGILVDLSGLGTNLGVIEDLRI